jgi:CBS domain containing-hemolysin-like protein
MGIIFQVHTLGGARYLPLHDNHHCFKAEPYLPSSPSPPLGLVGFFVSTAVIVIFGEIVPQAACSRYALGVLSALSVLPVLYVLLHALQLCALCVSASVAHSLAPSHTVTQSFTHKVTLALFVSPLAAHTAIGAFILGCTHSYWRTHPWLHTQLLALLRCRW